MREDAAYLAIGFRDVDGTARHGKLLGCLRFLDGLASFRSCKPDMLRLLELAEGMSGLDTGCGLGFDVARMASVVGPSGIAVGVDRARRCCAHRTQSLRSRRCSSAVWSSTSPSVTGGSTLRASTGRCSTSGHPRAWSGRCTASCGPAAGSRAGEPDWDTFVMAGGERDVTRRVVESWCSSFRNPWIGRSLTTLLHEAGFGDVAVTGHVLVAEKFDAVDRVFGVVLTARRVAAASGDPHLVERWLDTLRSADTSASVTLYLATGRRAAASRT